MAYALKTELFPLHGGCPCGHVRYQLDQPPLLVHCCHCTACQRQLGTAFAINAIVEATAITVHDGPAPKRIVAEPEPAASLQHGFATLTRAAAATPHDEHRPPSCLTSSDVPRESKDEADAALLRVTIPSESGIGQTIVRCPVCRAGLWSHYVDAGPLVVYLRVGTLDRAWEIDPDVHIYTRSKRHFIHIADGKPQFETYYPDRADLYRPAVLERVEILKPMLQSYMAELRAALR
ncbi:hypothetical protein DCS_07448 [Drechmeria coniospora]|uniref:CENP-V/GFA domain-containing protein n=1 Tax=Drechmeria coniospora TaxID=98403 RepID=A0A151GEG8_DRECN|nr:hypothetical protein DCS_07448 [Drechmeria coniospora]KYK55485.1 hypothetical protein DCS_07448 [Drechmeria coniospora]